MMRPPTLAAYYYPGWHPCPIRDAEFPKDFSEWDLVTSCRPRFRGHRQPMLPLWGKHDESDPNEFERKIDAAVDFGIDIFVFAFFWSRGKRLLEGALKRGFLGNTKNERMKFALMWANRMPRRVLPVKNPRQQLIDPTRLVHTDGDDFLNFIKHIACHYFGLTNYFAFRGGKYLSIFDTNFFLRQMGEAAARECILVAREWLSKNGFGELHLAAIDPIPEFWPTLKSIGFDSVTHYVFLPDWKGDLLQDFEEQAEKKARMWQKFKAETDLPYFPSVSPGWDASARAVDYGKERPKRYPWSPIVSGSHPQRFGAFLKRGLDFTRSHNPEEPLCFIASWNEWSEGHYIEPDITYKYEWLEAVRAQKQTSGDGTV